MTHQSPSAKSVMSAPRLYASFIAMIMAITAVMLVTQTASARDYHKHRNGNFSVQFSFGNGHAIVSSRSFKRHKFHGKHYQKRQHRAVVHTCSPRQAKRIARKHYRLRHAQIVRVNRKKIVIAGKRRGHVQRIAFGHYCQPLRR